MASSGSRERALGAVSMLALAVGAVAVVLAVPRNHAIVEIALVMVPVSAVVIAAMAWRVVWGEGKKRQYVLTRERRKLVAYGLFALAAIAVGALITMMQPGNPVLAFGFLAAAAQINALFEGPQPRGVVAASKRTT